ncbi:MAG: integrin, partial [Pseudomonadota bacterium]|nr:integrin [Pseudomonadota bacterium]
FAIGLDASGDTLAVSGFNEDTNRGSIYIFSRDNNRWSEQARVQASNAEIGDALASAIAVSADGNTIVGGAFDEDSALIGVPLSNEGSGDQPTDLAVGAAYVFVRDDNEWLQQAFIKPTNTRGNQHFGWAVALSLDGNTLVGGAHFENGGSQGINGDQQDDSSPDSGAAYVYQRTGTTWVPIAYVKAPNASPRDEFGMAVALNGDGTVLAVGAPREASSTSDIEESKGDETAPESGAVYVY